MKKMIALTTVATGLLLGLAVMAPGATATVQTFQWEGNGFPNGSCVAGQVQTMLWIFNDNGSAVPTGLTINGVAQAGSWQQQGGGTYHFTTTGAQFPPVEGATTFATYTGTLGNSTVLTLSGCNEGGTTTTTSPTTTTSTTTPTTTTTTSTTTTTTPTTTTSTTTTTTPTTTTTVPGGGGSGGSGSTTTTTTPPAATSTTTAPPVGGPGPGGGGGNGGGGSNQIQPIGTAFTGFEVQPWMWIAAIGLLLLGSTMLMRGYAVRNDDE